MNKTFGRWMGEWVLGKKAGLRDFLPSPKIKLF